MQYTDPTMIHRLAIVISLVLLAATGCDRAETTEKTGSKTETSETKQENGANYSPFGVRLQKGEDYELISFKDVGLGNPAGVSDAMLYETIAQSLAYQLRVDRELTLAPRVIHEPALADPNNHVYCEKDRVYVDLWRSQEPHKWGYSLWSGCSADARFQWREVEAPKLQPDALASGVEPLTRDIVESLENADREDCYRRQC